MGNQVLRTDIETSFANYLANNNEVNEVSNTLFGSDVNISKSLDFHIVGFQDYPMIDIFCYSEKESKDRVSFFVNIKLFVKRDFGDDGVLEVEAPVISEVKRVSMVEFSTKITEWFKECLTLHGVNGAKRFDFDEIIRNSPIPMGQDDLMDNIEIEFSIKKCLIGR